MGPYKTSESACVIVSSICFMCARVHDFHDFTLLAIFNSHRTITIHFLFACILHFVSLFNSVHFSCNFDFLIELCVYAWILFLLLFPICLILLDLSWVNRNRKVQSVEKKHTSKWKQTKNCSARNRSLGMHHSIISNEFLELKKIRVAINATIHRYF